MAAKGLASGYRLLSAALLVACVVSIDSTSFSSQALDSNYVISIDVTEYGPPAGITVNTQEITASRVPIFHRQFPTRTIAVTDTFLEDKDRILLFENMDQSGRRIPTHFYSRSVGLPGELKEDATDLLWLLAPSFRGVKLKDYVASDSRAVVIKSGRLETREIPASSLTHLTDVGFSLCVDLDQGLPVVIEMFTSTKEQDKQIFHKVWVTDTQLVGGHYYPMRALEYRGTLSPSEMTEKKYIVRELSYVLNSLGVNDAESSRADNMAMLIRDEKPLMTTDLSDGTSITVINPPNPDVSGSSENSSEIASSWPLRVLVMANVVVLIGIIVFATYRSRVKRKATD